MLLGGLFIIISIIFCSVLLFIMIHNTHSNQLFYPFSNLVSENRLKPIQKIKDKHRECILSDCNGQKTMITKNSNPKIHILWHEELEYLRTNLNNYDFNIIITMKEIQFPLQEDDLTIIHSALFTYFSDIKKDDWIFVVRCEEDIPKIITTYYGSLNVFISSNIIGVRAKYSKRLFYKPLSTWCSSLFQFKKRAKYIN